MGKVVTALSVSLDGFVAGPNDGPEKPLGEGGDVLFKWYEAGDTEYTFPGGPPVVHVSAASARVLREESAAAGAVVAGRRLFQITNGWNGSHPLNAPIFVVTNHVPRDYMGKESPFTFVTDGVESAIKQAQKAAGDKDVVVASASLVQQCLKLGLMDEIQLDLVPFLLGKGVSLFDRRKLDPHELLLISIVEGSGVTHLRFQVVK